MAVEQDQLVKCVPNFSEGSDEHILKEIKRAIESVPRCEVLSVSPGGKDTNRTIYTFVGPKNNVVQAALCAAEVAYNLIDMRKQKGEHPRIGALDICPFVPLQNVAIEECVKLAEEFGEKLAEKFNVPVYFYERMQEKEYRKTTRQIREKEYEGLQERLKDRRWKPDCGPSIFVPTWGATITGARYPLISLNVNILGTKEQAAKIARKLRGEGSGPDQPGLFRTVKATAFHMPEHDMSQVCMSLTDYRETPMHTVFEACCEVAKSLNIAVVGSEVHGLVPLHIILQAADFYMKESNVLALQERQKVRLAVDRLRLSSITEFKPDEMILEYRMQLKKDGPMLTSNVRLFLESIAYGRITPGAGCVTTTMASMGVGLCTMVGLLSAEGENFDRLREAIVELHAKFQKLLPLIDTDAEAVEVYVHTQDLPQDDQESFARENTKSLKRLCTVPLEVMRCACQCWPHVELIADYGNPVINNNTALMGAQILNDAIQMTGMIIEGNLRRIDDREFCAQVTREVRDLTDKSKYGFRRVQERSQ